MGIKIIALIALRQQRSGILFFLLSDRMTPGWEGRMRCFAALLRHASERRGGWAGAGFASQGGMERVGGPKLYSQVGLGMRAHLQKK